MTFELLMLSFVAHEFLVFQLATHDFWVAHVLFVTHVFFSCSCFFGLLMCFAFNRLLMTFELLMILCGFLMYFFLIFMTCGFLIILFVAHDFLCLFLFSRLLINHFWAIHGFGSHDRVFPPLRRVFPPLRRVFPPLRFCSCMNKLILHSWAAAHARVPLYEQLLMSVISFAHEAHE